MIRSIPCPILLMFSFLLLWQAGNAQDTEFRVQPSRDKIILEGKIYYIHVVAEKETLYGISRAYNVTEKVIAAENPAVFAGLQPGMVLKIPAEPVVDESVEIRETDDYFYHVIREGETLYFLSKKYGIDVVEIEKANPEVTVTELEVNQVLKIPKRKNPPQEKEFPADSFIYHYVQAGETLYSISVKYDVSIEEIKEINPELRWGELKYDEYIRIPRHAEIPSPGRGEGIDSLMAGTDTLLVDSLQSWMDTLRMKGDTAGIPFWSTLRRRRMRPEPLTGSIRVAMLLPLYLHWDEVRDTLELEEAENEEALSEEEEQDMINPRIVGYLEFYEGALLALDSLRKQGHSVTLYTFDTERDRGRVREILRKPEMQEMDLIIGPVNYWNLEIVAAFARRNRIPMVSPFSSRKDIVYYNPWVFQITPTYEVEFRAWAKYLSDYYDKTIILVHSGDSSEYDRINFLKKELFGRISEKADLEDLVFKEVIMNDSVQVDMANVLNSEQENLVIVPSANEAYVSNVISPLYYQLDDYEIQVSGMPQWNRFRNIDLIYFHRLNISYYTSFYMDFNKPEMKAFIDRYYKVYRTQPYIIRPRGYNLSVYGYDLMFAFVNGLAEYGRNLIFFGEEMENNPLLGPYRFRRISDYGGHINTYISMVKFTPELNISQFELDVRPEQIFRYRRRARQENEDW